MKRIISLVLTISLSTSMCQAIDSAALTNAAIFVKTAGLESEHSSLQVMEQAVRSNGWTQQDCTDVLLLAYKMSRDSPSDIDVSCSCQAVSLLGQFGGTNALPALVEIMRVETSTTQFYAGQGYLRIAAAHPFEGWEDPLREAMLRASTKHGSFSWSIYKQTSDDLKYAGPSEEYRENLLRFLLDQSAVELGERAMLDEILCREVPKWRASPQRAENAAKMIRKHPGDSEAVAFFEGVRADAITARAKEPPETDRSEESPTPSERQMESSATGTDSDPWAELLRDLPEKQPWTPPPGAILPH